MTLQIRALPLVEEAEKGARKEWSAGLEGNGDGKENNSQLESHSTVSQFHPAV